MSVDDLAVLKRQRATIKASCTRIKTFVESIKDATPSLIAQIEERKIKLDKYWSDYETVQTQIEALDEIETEDRTAFEEAFYFLASKMRELLQPPPVIGPSTSSTASPVPSMLGARGPSDNFTNTRLPKLNLLTFSGKYDEWFPFYDNFTSVIHSNTTLTDVQKLQYLRGSLTGDAAKIIGSLETSGTNYEVAWTLLKKRFDNERVIVYGHVKAILELPPMAKENYAKLREFADDVARHLNALKALKCPTDYWDALLIPILTSKLDPVTSREWRSSLKGAQLPTQEQFFEFLTHQCQTLEDTDNPSVANTKVAGNQPHFKSSVRKQSSCAATVKIKCHYCQGDHAIYYCKDFLALPTSRRISEIRGRKICVNCLRSTSHVASKCSSGNCKVCQAKHNTLLHATNASPDSSNRDASGNEASKTTNSQTPAVTSASGLIPSSHIMLSTAVVYAYDTQGSLKPCRALLDCGSQANFISRKLLSNLGLKSRSLNVSISGISGTTTSSTQSVQLKLQSRFNSYNATINCIVTDRVTDKLPAVTLKRDAFAIPNNINLADPQFHVSSEVDLLIGAEIFWDLMCIGQIKSSDKHPTLQKTRLGWILAGRSGRSSRSSKVQSFHASITNSQLHDQLGHLWQLDDGFSRLNDYTLEGNLCEQHFLDNVSRTAQGRFVVKLPIKEQLIRDLGDSREFALKRFRGLEKRFKRNPELTTQYSQFVNEYISLGHMRRINLQDIDKPTSFYLPHHCVFKGSGQSSKLRVVFDASCKSSTGLSLNDTLMTGPVVQQDLMSILTRFRTFRYAITADIVKMYRQVLIHPSQTCLQRILWRNNPNDELDTYELITVTYGTSPASYLATRCLSHLAELHSSEYPIGSTHVKRDFYVDDLLTGADTIQEAKLIRDEIMPLLRSGGFELSKWASNCSELLENVGDRSGELVTIKDEIESSVLGVQWNQTKDMLHFSYKPDIACDTVSKRIILSGAARLFDPLGLLGPSIVVAKLILQELWQAGAHWDESVPQDIHTRWSSFKAQLASVNELRIPRCVKLHSDPQLLQLHGFCDASQKAYGACVYIRTKLGPNEYQSELLCSKSRIAPIKAVSLPRLELSAALLLARLIAKISETIDLANISMFLWSDSTITLNWISSSSRKWSVFVANRVGEIQRLTEVERWRHVASPDNPADVLSRGLNPRELAAASMWWHGPAFLQIDDDHWPSGKFQIVGENIPEQKRVIATVVTVNRCIINELLNKHSNLNKVCGIVAYCLRLSKARHPRAPVDIISSAEASFALQVMCRTVQAQAFPNEYRALSQGTTIHTSSNLLSLSPIMDDNGLMQVGGRLKNSDLQHDERHPILLPRDHELTKRIIEREHIRNMHAGTQATMATVRQRFWPLSLRSVTRKIVQKCVVCFKAKPRFSEATMGSLPAGRVTGSRPFHHCGVDYAGPIILREGKRRNAKNHKAYIAIFVCFATKAVHIDLVSDLTSNAFIAAFKRFISRRGKPSHMYSDNGTTFVGARKHLKELYEFYRSQQTQSDIAQFLRDQEISWNFIPPNSPHFGGLWEAAVKSAKLHMTRIIGKAHLTFEEMLTVLSEIEAILNSRPLTPLSADPNDLAYLSPGHFLVGTALNSFPCNDVSDINENRLTRWQRLEQLRQHFWRRWSHEYLHSLQEKFKWKVNKGIQMLPNQIVLIKQPNLPPLQWAIGRIHEIHPGSDEVARTATVKTAKGFFVRPLSRLAILPIET